jgi:hypothetical protein
MHTLRPMDLPDPRREQMQLEGRYYTLPVASRSPTGDFYNSMSDDVEPPKVGRVSAR